MPNVTVERRLTVQGALDAATGRLAAAGIERPRQEATRLLADLLELDAGRLLLERGAVIEPDRRRWIDRAVGRRAAGEPLGYVTGVTGFRHLTIRTDRRALIPRPETEGLVDRALAVVPGGRVADVGTGTGCLALALRQEGRYDSVLGFDRSAEALTLADQNRRRLGLAVALVRGDLLEAVGPASLDLVVTNPPYLTEAEYLALDPSVRSFEPEAALVSGPNGLQATIAILQQAMVAVRPGGAVVMEIAADRPAESARAAEAAGWRGVVIERDLFDRPRYLIGRREGA